MVLNPFRYLEGLTHRRRLKRYSLQVKVLMNDQLPLEDLPVALSEFWRQVQLDDFLRISPQHAMSATLKVRHDNFPQLIAFITEFNDHMANERDSMLETQMKNAFVTFDTVVLDTYFADDKHMPIDLKHNMVRFQGALLHHRYLLDLQTSSQYYHRLAERIYNEVRMVTQALVVAINEEARLSST